MSEHIDDRILLDESIGMLLMPDFDAVSGSPVVVDRGRTLRLATDRITGRNAQSLRRSRQRALTAAAALLGVAAIIAVGMGAWVLSRTPRVEYIQISWPYAYASVTEIGDASPLVVVGTVVALVRDGPDPNTPNIPQSAFAVRVDGILKGTATGSTITVLQSGGHAGGALVEVEDDPLMAAGEHVVLFLRPVMVAGQPAYAIVGGPQGRLLVQEGRVHPVAGDFHLPLPPGTTIKQIQSDVRQ